jgi:hypothetical protein
MLTVTAKSFHDRVHIEQEEITLNGPPSFLSGTIGVTNNDSGRIFIRELPLSDSVRGRKMPGMPEHFKLVLSLKAGEKKMHRIRYRAPATTPPGTYESTILAGGKEKKLKLVIQPNIDISIWPLNLHFNGVAPEALFTSQLSFTNSGNVPFKIPEIKHANILDPEYLCRASSLAVRKKGGEGYAATLDEMAANIQKDMAGWAIVRLEETGKIIEPGETIPVHFTLTLPKDANPRKDYFGNIRIWNRDLSFEIKSHENDTPKNKKNG